MSLQVRAKEWRGQAGWLVCGKRPGDHRSLSIWFEHEEAARRHQKKLKAAPLDALVPIEWEC